MIKKWIIGFVAIGCLWNSNAFAQKKGKAPKADEDYIYTMDKKELEVQNLYISAVNEKLLGNFEDAVGLFKAVLKLDADNHAAYYELSRIAFGSNDLKLAEEYAAKAVKLQPQNEWYQVYLAEARAKKGDFAGAAEAYADILEYNPDAYDYLRDIAYMQVQANDKEGAIATYNKIQKIEGISEALSMQKQSLYLQLDKVEKAAEEVRQLINEFPDLDNYYAMLAEIYSVNRMNQKAIDTYNLLLEKKPNNPQALLAIAEIQRKDGNEAAYKKTIKQVFGNPALDINTKIFLFIPYIENVAENPTISEEVLEMSKLIKSTHPNDAKAVTAHADVLYNIGRKEDAVEAYKTATTFEESPITVWLQLFELFSNEGNFEMLKEYGSKATVKFPDDATPLFYAGLANAQLKEYAEAAEFLESALQKNIPNPQAIAQILSSLGDVYNEMGNFEKSDSCYDEVLVINPNDAFTLNNYAYYLSLRKEKLDKAKRMSKRSNILVENNASFQDTYAWILYEMGEYEDAKEWLEKALLNASSEGSDRPVLLEHYGDILYKLGDKKGALEHWKKALEVGGDAASLQPKIDQKALIE